VGVFIQDEPDGGLTKEQWVLTHGVDALGLARQSPCFPDGFNYEKYVEDHRAQGEIILCLVDNVEFYAVGVMFDAEEMKRADAYGSPVGSDLRDKRWFKLPIALVVERCPELTEELYGAWPDGT
jgi:hypothetical protein